ncbi:protein kinase domain-containing protein [Streptomyces afghaniensis]|uniref:protein kinase domain-containing protein n=1 Tax=Streptomyces afghaniensis TaxID=66865 RepID=UPI001427CB56
MQQYGRLSEQCVLALAAELFGALAAVHAAGLTHRDVKPSNVLLGRRSPLLIDFGIARAREDTRHTRTGGVIGSPGYLAPEQVSAGESGAAGDVFALAAVLVYAATGRGPFSSPDDEFSPAVAALPHRAPGAEPRRRSGGPDPTLAVLSGQGPRAAAHARHRQRAVGTLGRPVRYLAAGAARRAGERDRRAGGGGASADLRNSATVVCGGCVT